MGPPGLGSGVGAGCTLLAGRRPEAVGRDRRPRSYRKASRFRAAAERCDPAVTESAPLILTGVFDVGVATAQAITSPPHPPQVGVPGLPVALPPPLAHRAIPVPAP